MGELNFKYKCHFCGKEVKMGTIDIVQFIGKQYCMADWDQLPDFFTTEGKKYNLCPKCAREEGVEMDDFEGV